MELHRWRMQIALVQGGYHRHSREGKRSADAALPDAESQRVIQRERQREALLPDEGKRKKEQLALAYSL